MCPEKLNTCWANPQLVEMVVFLREKTRADLGWWDVLLYLLFFCSECIKGFLFLTTHQEIDPQNPAHGASILRGTWAAPGLHLAEAHVVRAAVMHSRPQGPTSLGHTPRSHRAVLSKQGMNAPPQLSAQESLVKTVTLAFVLPVIGQLKRLADAWT